MNTLLTRLSKLTEVQMFSQVCCPGGGGCYRPQTKFAKAMFSQCAGICPQGGCLPHCMLEYTPQDRHPPAVHAGIQSTSGQYAPHWNAFLFHKRLSFHGKGGCLPDNPLGRHPPPPPHPADGYCCGWYAFYWNVFLYFDNNTFKSSHTRCVDNAPFLIVRICDVFVHHLCCTANNIKRSECIYLVKNLATCQWLIRDKQGCVEKTGI